MKAVLTLLILFLTQGAYAQWSWVDTHPSHNVSIYTGHAIFQDSLILIGGQVSQGSCYFESHFIINMKTGDTLYMENGRYGNALGHSFYPFDNSYLVGTYDWGQDDVGNDGRIRIVKKDEKGAEIWHLDHPFRPKQLEKNCFTSHIDISSNGTVLVATDLSIVLFDTIKKSAIEMNHSIPDSLIHVSFISDSTLFCATTTSAYTLDTTGQVIDSITGYAIHNIAHQGPILVIVFDKYIARYDSKLNVIDTVYSSTEDVIDFQTVNAKDYVLEQHVDGIAIFELTFGNATLINKIERQIEGHFDFELHDSSLYVFDSEQRQMHIDCYPLYEHVNAPFHGDLSLEVVKLRKLEFQPIPPPTFNFKTEVTVKNNGDHVINSFALYSYFRKVHNCESAYYYELFDSVSILPGSSVSVLGTVNGWDIGAENAFMDMCFTLMAPNSGLDADFDNNEFCDRFQLLAVSEEQKEEILIYPNPVVSTLYLNNSDQDWKVLVLDIHGKMIFEADQKVETIDVSQWANGVYFVTIRSDKMNRTKKIVVSH